MKKFAKIVILCLCTALLCVSLTGCDFIDEMRECQAFYNEDGNIVLEGNVEYIPIQIPEGLQVSVDYEEMVYVTERDVPVLLSEAFGATYYKSKDEIFLEHYEGDSDVNIYYCRADKYDFVEELVGKDYVPAGYVYTYYDYIVGEEKEYHLTGAQSQAVEAVLSTVTPTVIPDNYEIYWDCLIETYTYGEQDILRRYEFDIGLVNETYSIVIDGENIYEVPVEYNSTFERITEKYLEQY